MTARGEDLLAWLDTAITIRATAAQLAAEGGSGRWYSGGRTDDPYVEDWQLESDAVWDYDQDKLVVDNEVHPSKARSVHIALNDPEAVLRRCTADRQMLTDIKAIIVNGDCIDDGELPLAEHFLLRLAEGYGWQPA